MKIATVGVLVGIGCFAASVITLAEEWINLSPYHSMVVGVCFGLLVAGAFFSVRKACAASSKTLRSVLPFSEASGKFALAELERAAPHLFELRKVGLEYSLPHDVRQGLSAVDEVRARRILNFIDGRVVARRVGDQLVAVPE